MTPKEKARELVNKFQEILYGYDVFDDDWVKCIYCALTLCDEILEICSLDCLTNLHNHEFEAKFNYWKEVKQEIEEL